MIKDYKLERVRRERWRKARLSAAIAILQGTLARIWVIEEAGWARFLLGFVRAAASGLGILDGWGGFLFHLAEGGGIGRV